MTLSRRDFFKKSALGAAGLALAGALDLGMNVRRAVAAGETPFQGIVNLQWPLFSNPAMVRPGDPVPIRLKDSGTSVLSADLVASDGALIPLDVQATAVPKNLAPGVYGLKVKSGKAGDTALALVDEQPRAVAVYPEFKDDYDFVYFADIHFGEHEGTLPDTAVTPDMKDYYKMRARTLMEIQKINPEFIVLGGDLALYPRTYHIAFPEVYAFLLAYLRSPIHIVPGNHDSYHMAVNELGGQYVRASDFWSKYFGQTYHSFDYGKLHVSCWNTSDWPEEYIHWGSAGTSTGTLLNSGFQKEQFEWMKADLEGAAARGSETAVCCHIPLHNIISGRKIGLPAVKLPGAPEAAVFKIMEAAKVNHVFVGHLHKNDEATLNGSIQEHMIRNVGGDYFESKDAGFAVVHVRGGRITGFDAVDVKS